MDASSPSSGDLREELRSDAHSVAASAKNRLAGEVDARKGTAAEQAQTLSSALDAAAGELSDSPDWLRSLFEKGAQSLQRFAETIETKDTRQLTREVQQVARDNPVMFLAGAAAAGFAAARVLKAGMEDISLTSSQMSAPQPHEAQSAGYAGTAFTGLDESEPGAPYAFKDEM